MEQPPNRPNLPLSTPAPGPMGRRNVYATKLAHLNVASHSSPQLRNSLESKEFALPDKSISKIISKLPYEVRETVTAVVNMSMVNAHNIQKDLEISRHEVTILRNDLSKKINEFHSIKKTCQLYEERIRTQEENIEILKDNLDSRQKFNIKNKSAMVRLSSTNKMLIDALDALQNSTNTYNLVTSKSLGQHIANNNEKHLSPIKENIQTSHSGGSLEGKLPLNKPIIGTAATTTLFSPIKKNNNHGGKEDDYLEYEQKDQKVSLAQNDKLRESLLRVAREHYRSMKNADILEAKVIELRESLRSHEKQNRLLKAELEEVRILLNVEDDANLTNNKASNFDHPKSNKRKNYGVLDEKFQALLDKNGFDPIDGIQLLRRILSRMAAAPSDLSLTSMITHIVAQDTIKIFDCDMLSIFIKHPNRPDILHRYSVQSSTHTEINIAETKCLAGDVIRYGKVARLNGLTNSNSYNSKVDGCTGVITKRILSLPIYNIETSHVFGCIHIINKSKNELFSEIDELFGLLFADQASLLLSSCVRYDYITSQAKMIQNLLESSTALFSCIPDSVSLTSTRPLSTGTILKNLEDISREILKCANVRAFLISDYTSDISPGQMVLLDYNKSSITSSNTDDSTLPVITSPLHSGIVGHVIKTRTVYQVDDIGFDPYLNSIIDVDPINLPLVVIPIMDLFGTIIGCLELVVGQRSPKLAHSEEFKDQQGLLFIPAAQWLVYQIAAPLQYMLKFIGSIVNHPIVIPHNIDMKKGITDYFTSSFEDINIVNQIEESVSLPKNKIIEPIKSDIIPYNATINNNNNQSINNNNSSKVKITDYKIHEDFINELNKLKSDLKESRDEVMSVYNKLHDVESNLSVHNSKNDEYINKIVELEKLIENLNELLHKKNNDTNTTKDLASLDQALIIQSNHNDEVLIKLSNEKKKLSALNKTLETSLDESKLLLQSLQNENIEINDLLKILKDDNESIKDMNKGLNDKSINLEIELNKLNEQMIIYQNQINDLTKIKTEQSVIVLSNNATNDNNNNNNMIAIEDHELKLNKITEQVKNEMNEIWMLKTSELQNSFTEFANVADNTIKNVTDESVNLKKQIEELLGNNNNLINEIQIYKEKTQSRSDKTNEIPPTIVVDNNINEEIMKDFQLQIEKLTTTIVQKDSVISILQGQVVRMAEQNMKVSDQALMSQAGVQDLLQSTTIISNHNIIDRKGPPPSLNKQASIRGPLISRSGSSNMTNQQNGFEQNNTANYNNIQNRSSGSWNQHVDEFGTSYYYNESTGESSWHNPNEPPEQIGDWIKSYDENGNEYWIHEISGESVWEIPVTENHPSGGGGIYDTTHSQYSASAGNYTIEL